MSASEQNQTVDEEFGGRIFISVDAEQDRDALRVIALMGPYKTMDSALRDVSTCKSLAYQVDPASLRYKFYINAPRHGDPLPNVVFLIQPDGTYDYLGADGLPVVRGLVP